MLQLTQDDLQLIAMIMSTQLLIIYNNPSGQPVPVFGHPHTSAKLLCSWVPPTYTGVGGCSSSFAGLCTSLCQTLYKVPVSSFLQPVKVPLAYQPLLQICVISQIAELLSVPSFRPLVKMLNRTRSVRTPWGSLLVTTLQLYFTPLITTLKVCPFIQFSIPPTAVHPVPTATAWGYSGTQCQGPYWWLIRNSSGSALPSSSMCITYCYQVGQALSCSEPCWLLLRNFLSHMSLFTQLVALSDLQNLGLAVVIHG